MIVAGGTYEERVTVPDHQVLAGSGLRAAAALSGNTDVKLVTASDEQMRVAADASFATLNVPATVIVRDEPVRFRYFTPVMPPIIDGPSSRLMSTLTAEDENALVFGMIESGTRSIRARKVVIDPQRPRDLAALDLTGIEYDEIAIVANAREIRSLAPTAGTLEGAAEEVRLSLGASAVIVKHSGRGCLVSGALPEGIVRVGPFPTRTVWPLGSGDVFAAGFAHAWMSGADPVEAARVGSASAAWWCGTRNIRIPDSVLRGGALGEVCNDAAAELSPILDSPVIYLAAPFFNLAERWLVESCREVLIGLGAQVFSPLHDVGVGGDEVAERDLDGLNRAQAVFAVLDGWDPGTVYEVGWAHHRGLPVVGFLKGPAHEGTKMLVGSGAELHQDISSALYRAVWAAQGHPLSPGRVLDQ